MNLKVRKDFLPVNEYSRPGEKLNSVYGLVFHWTGAAGQAKETTGRYFEVLAKGTHERYASAHFIVDEEGVLQVVPMDEVAYHAGASWWNENTLGIEMCHPSWTGEFEEGTLVEASYLGAVLCIEFDLDPRMRVFRHYDVTGKVCPKLFVEKPWRWLEFKKMIADEKEILSKQRS